MTTAKGGPKVGSKKTAAHKAKIAKAQDGKANSNYKDGNRNYRKVAGAKEGEIVHHKNGDRTQNNKSNLQVLKGKKKGAKTSATHEKLTDRGAGRKPKK